MRATRVFDLHTATPPKGRSGFPGAGRRRIFFGRFGAGSVGGAGL